MKRTKSLPKKDRIFENCVFCKRRFEISRVDNSRYLPDGRAVCASCFEDHPDGI